jgi:hypothetical protein
MTADTPPPSSERKEKVHKKEYEYFVNNKEYKTEHSALTGAQIKAQIPDFNPAYQLVLEEHGGKADKVIPDSETVDLNVHPRCHFYTVPPATFGRI